MVGYGTKEYQDSNSEKHLTQVFIIYLQELRKYTDN